MRVYLKVWITSTDALGAPLNDLYFLKDLNGNKNTSNDIYKLALKVFSVYLCYLSNIGLVFIDNRISDDIKVKIVKALNKSGADIPEYRIKLPEQSISSSELYEFITNNTHKLFTALNIKIFFSTCPSTWKNNTEYLDGYEKVIPLKW